MQLYCAVGRAKHSAHMSFHRTGSSGQASKPTPFLQPFMEQSLENERFRPLTIAERADTPVEDKVRAHEAPFEMLLTQACAEVLQ
jgi:hypothetical protein